MTTKRKAILKTIAVNGSATLDDLHMSTGFERKNLTDNVKACIKADLVERIRDDVTGLPAYKLTADGRTWLENDKDNSSTCVKPQPEVGTNTGSKDAGSAVGSGMESADPLPVGNAVSAPPKPDDSPVAAGADVTAIQKEMDQEVRLTMAGKTITEFCEWLAKKAKVRCPLNLRECKTVVTDLMQAGGLVNDLKSQLQASAKRSDQLFEDREKQRTLLESKRSEIEALQETIAEQGLRIAQLESNAELPLRTQTEPARYIVADSYQLAANAEQAAAIALDLAKEIEIDMPVAVFASTAIRELRINWRDA